MLIKTKLEKIIKTEEEVEVNTEFPFYLTEITESGVIGFIKYENKEKMEIYSLDPNIMILSHDIWDSLTNNYWDRMNTDYKKLIITAANDQALERLKFEFFQFLYKNKFFITAGNKNSNTCENEHKRSSIINFIKNRFLITK
jgi:hypothetical protein